MDVIGMIGSAVKYGIQALEFAKANGMLGGSTGWIDVAVEYAGLFDRAQVVLQRIMANPDEYDQLAALPQDQLEAEIQKRVYPTPLGDLVNRVKGQMGL